jgi:hypothetical protein
MPKTKNIKSKKPKAKKPKAKAKRSLEKHYGNLGLWKTKTKKRDELRKRIQESQVLFEESKLKNENAIQEIYDSKGIEGVKKYCEYVMPTSFRIDSKKAPYLESIDPYVIEKIQYLIMKCYDQMDPFLNGLSTLKELHVEVDDTKMKSFTNAMSKSGCWEFSEQCESVGYSLGLKQVNIMKWRTDDRKVLDDFFRSFEFTDDDLIERHFMHTIGSCLNAVQIPKECIENMAALSYDIIAKRYGIKGNDLVISSCEMILGEQGDKKNNGYFTIEYCENVHPLINTGELRFSFRYENFWDGTKFGYQK